jgi:hypothetical protein
MSQVLAAVTSTSTTRATMPTPAPVLAHLPQRARSIYQSIFVITLPTLIACCLLLLWVRLVGYRVLSLLTRFTSVARSVGRSVTNSMIV